MIKTVSIENTLMEAHMVSDFLTSNNIPCFVAGRNVSHLWGHFACNGFKVLVYSENFEEATLIASESSAFPANELESFFKADGHTEEFGYDDKEPILWQYILFFICLNFYIHLPARLPVPLSYLLLFLIDTLFAFIFLNLFAMILYCSKTARNFSRLLALPFVVFAKIFLGL
jgi:hypothetical protein